MTDTTTPTTKSLSPRKPQDRLPSKSEILAAESAPPVGHDLLRPVVTLRSGEMADAQASILDLFSELGIDMTADTEKTVEVENSPATVRIFGKLGSLLERYAVDAEAFADLDRGPGAGTRMAELAMWYMAELGK